jgi:hypothetical protein
MPPARRSALWYGRKTLAAIARHSSDLPAAEQSGEVRAR